MNLITDLGQYAFMQREESVSLDEGFEVTLSAPSRGITPSLTRVSETVIGAEGVGNWSE